MIEITLATYALTLALTESAGAFGVFTHLRNKTERFGLLQCSLCTSFWLSGGLVWAFKPEIGILGWLGVWGACNVLERLINAYIVK